MDNKQDKGFTLVELLIVIVILGILATVTVLAVSGITDQAKENTCVADGATLQTAYESAFVQNSAVIPVVGDLVDALSANNAVGVVSGAPTAAAWGYVAPTASADGSLTPPTGSPSGCTVITLT
jgi:prepilin-type N-terminal cleavage/methylation domain-containing protein